MKGLETVAMKTVTIKRKRSSRLAYILAACAVSLLPLAPAGCGGGNGVMEAGRIKVAADIVPLADFCRAVGGDLVEVETMVPPGANPHAYEPTTGQMTFLSQASVLVINGLGLAPWTEDILMRVDNPRLRQVAAGEAVPEDELIAAGGHGREGGHGEGIYDPHVWLDPGLAVYMVGAIRDGLIAADPDNEDTYAGNAAAYLSELEGLDSFIRGEVAGFRERQFIAFHSSWLYFARRYGLVQAGVIEGQPGKEPSAREIADLVDLMEEKGVTVVFAEPQSSPRAAEVLAGEAGGGGEVMTLDPLGDPSDPDTGTYVEMMRHNVEVMGEALR